MQQNKLLRVIVMDSYFKGKRIEVDASDFANLSGTNAAGKTTFLKLQRLFYGDTPSDIAKARGKIRKSFIDYYLPRKSSYLIFEYQNQTGIKQVVCFAKKDILSYLFVDKSYELTDYLQNPLICDDKHEMISCEDIYRKFTLANIDCALAASSAEYRKIILGTTSIKDKKLAPIRFKYSMAMPGKNLSLINNVVASALERTTDFERIKEMLSSIMRRGEPNQLEFNVDTHKLTKWQSDYRALKAIEVVNNNVRDGLTQTLSEIELNTTRLSEFKSDLIIYKNTYELTLSSNAALLDSSKAKWAESKEELNQDISLLSSAITTSRQEVSVLENKISVIEDEKLGWEDKNVAYLQSEYDKKSQYTLQLRTANDEFKALLDEVTEISGKYAKLREKRLVQFNTANKKLSQTLNEKVSALTLLKEQQSTARHNFKLEQQQEVSNKSHELNLNKVGFERDCRDITDKLNDVSAPKALTLQLAQLTKVYNTETQSFNTLSVEKLNADQSINEQTNKKRELARKQVEIDSSIKLLNIELTRLNQLLKPVTGTLHEFINDNVENWQDSFGKFISPTALKSKALNPSYEPQTNNNAIFGLTIDLEAIDSPYSTNEAEIFEQIKQAEVNLQSLQEDKLSLQSSFKEIEKELQSLQYITSTLSAKINAAQVRSESAKVNVQNIESQISFAIENAHKDLDNQLVQMRKNLALHDVFAKESLEQINADYAERFNLLVSNHSGSSSDLETFIDNINDSLTVLESDHNTVMKRLTAEQKQEENASGVDGQKRDMLEAEVASLQSKLESLRDYPAIIQGYNSWLKISYSKLPALHSELDNENFHKKELSSKLDVSEKKMN
jgi:chromosome segregation ATPase